MATDDVPPDPRQVFSNDDLYDVMADRRRRYAIHYLKQRREPVPVRELAEQVAAWENDKSIEALRSQERKRVYIALYQSHLPSMNNAGLVKYDEAAGTVELGATFENRSIYLEIVPKSDIPWSLYYVGLAAANLVVLGLAWADIHPFTVVPDLGWGVIVLVTFAASAIVQTYTTRRMLIGDQGPPPDLTAVDRE